jgi:two-component system, NtrC family, sensor histidine kinase PilS
LRRVLVNLLDNALRHASSSPASIRVELITTASPHGCVLSVWSDGPPIDHGVQRHLFEPFFSSQSRSSGLGLFICRELCLRHGASISYQRSTRQKTDSTLEHEGNEFLVRMRPSMEVTQPMQAISS